jgi:membrane protein implicated in regulation of membrane protease activity
MRLALLPMWPLWVALGVIWLSLVVLIVQIVRFCSRFDKEE